jgi:hypothetical protein
MAVLFLSRNSRLIQSISKLQMGVVEPRPVVLDNNSLVA